MKIAMMKKVICILLSIVVLFALQHRSRKGTSTFTPARIPDAILVIDAGHGGEDGGAVSISGAIESQINLEIALRVSAFLDLYGIEHLLLRDSDRSLHEEGCTTLREKKISDLHNRVNTIENTPNAILMSIHQNTFSSSKYHGAQVFYAAHEQSIPLAQTVQSTLKTAVDPENTRVPAQISSSVYLMNHITCPGILVECGFLSNPTEDALLQTAQYQTKLALALSSAYMTYQENTEEEPLYESS